MASSRNSISPKRHSPLPDLHEQDAVDPEIVLSLGQLSLGSPCPSPAPTAPATASARSPRSPSANGAYRPAVNRSASSLSVRGPSRSPLNREPSAPGLHSRSATPSLLRKASMNSIHAVNGVAPSPRSSSINLMSPTAASWSHRASPEIAPRHPPPTANSIAKAHFKGELDFLHGESSGLPAETVVILHDACYGHRYSRPRTSRAALNTIVERPERIRATVLGVAAAYVRLGERHAEGAHPLSPGLDPAMLTSIPFRIQKTARRLSLSSPTVTNVHGAKWMEELVMMCHSAEAKLAMTGKELQRPEMNRGPDHEEPKSLHEGDLYLCAESLEALEGSLGAVCEAVDAVFKDGGEKRAFVAARPPGHHCSASFPSGFCWINNVHVGIMHAIMAHGLTHVAIIDFDLHHGDGSQAIAWQHNARTVGLAKNAASWKKPSIGYFSLHDINSYPCELGDEEKVRNASVCIDNAHGQNVWNVHLEPWKTEAEFWELYETKYSVLLGKARQFLKRQTDRLEAANRAARGAIFFSAGFDASEWEGAGMQRHSVNVPTGFYARIARDVIGIAEDDDYGVNGRIISVLEGGYSGRALTSGVLSHLSGLAGSDPATKREEEQNGLGCEVGQKLSPPRAGRESLGDKTKPHPYDPSWWDAVELEKLESGIVPSPVQPRMSRNSTPHSYCSPTQASTARMVPQARLRRESEISHQGMPITRPPTPPPPDVPWAVAAQGLCKLLIPTDRPTTSCRPEDLSAEATRARRDLQFALAETPEEPAEPAVRAAPSRMGLRERKPVKYLIEEADEKRGKNRRRTVAGATVTAADKSQVRSITPGPNGRPPTRQSGRRLSVASTVVSDVDSLPASVNGRPETSMTFRPDSAMSVRTVAGGPLAVKKSRGTAASKKDASKGPRVKKAAGTAAATAAKAPSKPSSPHAGQSSEASGDRPSDDVDIITSGVRKIKINLIPKAQREARERESRERAVASPQGSGSGLHSPLSAAGSQDPLQTPLQQPENGPPAPIADLAATAEPHEIPLPPSTRASPARAARAPRVGPSAPVPDVFIPYQPEGPAPTAIGTSEPLQWLPPNTSTPSTRTRADLPVFTSTSKIPFAAPSPAEAATRPQGPAVKREGPADASAWEVPETPDKY